MLTQNNISFDENKYQIKSRAILGQYEVPGMTKFLLKKGIIKTKKTAHTFLITFTILFLITSIYVFAAFVFDIKLKTSTTSTEQIKLREERLQNVKKQININNTKNNQ